MSNRFLSLKNIFLLAVTLISSCGPENEDPKVELTVSFGNVSRQLTLTSATLTTTLNKNTGTLSEKGFLFGETPGLTLSGSQRIISPGSTTTISISVSDLTPSKEYYAMPYAIVDEKEFTGEEIKIQTSKPTYTSVSPLTAGRGQRVKIEGNFLTSEKSLLSIKIGGEQAIILSNTSSAVEFLVPEGAALGNSNIVFEIAGYNIGVTQAFTVSKWSILKDTPFNIVFSTDYAYSFLFNNKPSYGSYVFDPAKDEWTTDPAFGNSLVAAPLAYPIDFMANGKGYMGVAKDDKSFYEFDPVAKTWKRVSDFPGTGHGFLHGSWASNGGKGYYGLGYNVVAGVNTGLKEFWEFDPIENEWTRLKDYPGLAIHDGVAFSINEYVFVGGGMNRVGSVFTWPLEFFAYNTQDDTWTQVASLPVEPPGDRFRRAFAVGKKGYFFTQNNIWIYDFDSNTWELSDEVIPGPTDRSNYEIFCDGTKFYFGAGVDPNPTGFSYVKDFYKWYPED